MQSSFSSNFPILIIPLLDIPDQSSHKSRRSPRCLRANTHLARPTVQAPLTQILPMSIPRHKVIDPQYLPTSSVRTPQVSTDQLYRFSANRVSHNRKSIQAFRLDHHVFIASHIVRFESCHPLPVHLQGPRPPKQVPRLRLLSLRGSLHSLY